MKIPSANELRGFLFALDGNESASVTTTPAVSAIGMPVTVCPIPAAVSVVIIAIRGIDIVGTRIDRCVSIRVSIGSRMPRYIAISIGGARNECGADAHSNYDSSVSFGRTRQS
jgi:hypothetical protein